MKYSASSSEILSQVKVSKPCPANWAEMKGDDRVRHCTLCALNVYNLSAMSREEAAALVSNHEGRLCVRSYARADGKVMTKDCRRSIKQTVRYGRVSMAVFTFLGIGTAVAGSQLTSYEDPFDRTTTSYKLRAFQDRMLEFLGVAPRHKEVVGDTVGKLAYTPPPSAGSLSKHSSP